MKPRYYQKQAIEAYNSYEGNAGLIVLPTASGKSYVQADITSNEYMEGRRILLLTHQAELIKQNFEELLQLTSLIDAGIYSSSLKSRHTDNQIIFAGIQSVHKKALYLGRFDLILIDEAHLINTENSGMYRKFIDKSLEINPDIKLIGLTATPFRMKGGYLNYGKDALFKDFIHQTPVNELMDAEHPDNLDKTQYLSTFTTKISETKTDVSRVKILAGEYNKKELEQAFNVDDIVKKAVKEILEKTKDRKKVLIFCAGVEHSETVHQLIKDSGNACGIVHSKNIDSGLAVNEFKASKIKYLTNVNILTTGFNDPGIDCIVILRETKSVSLFVQMLGRGMRLFEGKKDCLALYFGSNIKELGTIDKPNVRNPSGKKGEAPVRECPGCHSLMFAASRFCPDCGLVFEFDENARHNETATEQNVVSEKLPPERVEVFAVDYLRHYKSGKPDSMRVEYRINMFKVAVSEYVCLDHPGFAKMKAMEWIRRNLVNEAPDTVIIDGGVDLLLNAANDRKAFKKPMAVMVDYNGDFARVVDYEYEEVAEREERLYEEIPF